MDMYQKRKMRVEKKNNDSQEGFSKVYILCEKLANAKLPEVLRNEHFTNLLSYVI